MNSSRTPGPPKVRAEGTPAAQALVVFALDGQQYGLRLEAVERVLPMIPWAPLPRAPLIVRGVINLHGAIIPVIDIRRRFGRPVHDYRDGGHLLVARASTRTLALPVDETLGVRHVDTRDVTPASAVVPDAGHITGVVAIDGGVLFIHDLDAFLSLEEARALDASLLGAP